MKKYIYMLFAVPVCLFSCKKDHSVVSSNTGKKYAVGFNITNFVQQKGVFSNGKHQVNNLKNNALENIDGYLDVLYYYVFDSNSVLVRRIAQDSTMAEFGNISDSLATGTYTIVMAAGKKGLTGTPATAGTTLDQSSVGYGSVDWADMFFDKFSLTISSSAVTQDVTLHRVVTKIELHVLDTIPLNANTITLTVFPEFPRFGFLDQIGVGTPDTVKTTISIPAAAKGKPDFIFDKIYGNQLAIFQVAITAKDASGHIIGFGENASVSAPQNGKALLIGKLFQSSNYQTFTVKADTSWNSTPFHVGF